MTNKKLALISLSCIALFGSLFTAFATNMLAADIGGIGAGLSVSTIIASIPSCCFAGLFVLAFLFILRAYKNPKAFLRMCKLYVIIAGAIAFVGLLTAFLSGLVLYHSFIKPYPFKGYLIIALVLFAIILGAAIYFFIRLRKVKDEEEKPKTKVSYVFSTIGWVLFIGLVFNRFGLLLVSPMYIYLRNLYLTLPFYVYLAVPLLFGIHRILMIFGILKDRKVNIIVSSCLLAVNLGLFLYTIFVGANNSDFISAISVAMPLDRLASKPIEIFIHFAALVAVGVISLVQVIKQKEPIE